MGEKYFTLKKRLEQLGYNKHLPPDGIPLVECLTADLLQTTRSLQHYMETAQNALQQRDELILQAEPYKCDNARLVKENNLLNKHILYLKEEHQKLVADTARKIKSLNDDISSKEETITKLKLQCRDTGLRGVSAATCSSRNKTRSSESKQTAKECSCTSRGNVAYESKITELQNKVKELTEHSECFRDEITLLQKKVDNRDVEIDRLNMVLEGGRPLSAIKKECGDVDMGHKVTAIFNEYKELQNENMSLTKQLEQSVEKQHEAMLRALNLADKNKLLEEELSKLDKLALKVEDECNNQIKTKNSENIYLREQVTELLTQNNKLKIELAERRTDSIEKLENSVAEIQKIKDYMNSAIKEKNDFFQEVKTLQSLNSSLQEKLTLALSQVSNARSETEQDIVSKLATKDDLKILWEKEKEDYETNALPLQKRMTDALEFFNKNLQQTNISPSESGIVYELYRKVSEAEHKVVELEKENSHLKSSNKNCYIIRNLEEQLAEINAENAHLKRENIILTKTLSRHNQGTSTADEIQLEKSKNIIIQLNVEIDRLMNKNQFLQNEKEEYLGQYKDALDIIDNLKRDIVQKQSQMEQLEDENVSYRLSSRSGRGPVNHLRDECNFLREQVLQMQSNFIKEKTMATQLKNHEAEYERSMKALQDELLTVKKQLTVTCSNYSTLENKCKDLQAEILSLQIEKTKLLQDLRALDKERDNMVIEIDKKNETISVLEQKMKSKSITAEKLENEITELKKTIILNSDAQHKLKDFEIKQQFLRSEVQRLKEHNENAVMENNRLKNSLANANSALKSAKIENEKSQKDADSLRLQLQHYVAEVKRIEDLLSHKEAERSDMLENFASLSVEANILENTKHSLENEAASKSLQLQTYKSKAEELEEQLTAKERTIDSHSAKIVSLSCQISSMENEIKILTEEKLIMQKNNEYLKNLCHKLESEKKIMDQGIQNTDSELQLYEHKIKKLSEAKTLLEVENSKIKANVQSVESLLNAARREVIELKLALQDATSETRILKEEISKLNEEVIRSHDLTILDPMSSEIEIEERLQAVTQAEELEEEFRASEAIKKRSMNYMHGSTI